MIELKCFHCSKIVQRDDKVQRRESCRFCGADLHVCRNCEFYDPASYNECRENQAERVVDKEKSNFCDYFQVRLTQSSEKSHNQKQESLQALNNLFKRK